MSVLSVIMPVYQSEKYLNQCIESILSQTFKDYELILIDDGSSDRSGKICDEYIEQDERIKSIHQLNQGVSSARNTGLSYATGKYITFVDADDWLEPDLFQKCITNIEKNKADVLYHGIIKDIWKDNEKKSVLKGVPALTGKISKNMLKEYFIKQEDLNDNVFCYIFTKELLEGIVFNVDLPYAEDNVFVTQSLAKAETYCFIDACGYHYNARIGSAAYRWQPKLTMCYKESFKETLKFLKTLNMTEEEMTQIISQKVINGYASLIYNLCLSTCVLKFKEKLQVLKEARNDFEVDKYKKFYRNTDSDLFSKIKTDLTFCHLEVILILLGTFYCQKS